MSEWKFEKIGALADTFAGGTPSRARSDFFGGDIPWISSGEVNKPVIYDTVEKITQEGFDNSSVKWIPKHSVLVAMYGATAGQVSKTLINATSNQAVLALVPKSELIDAAFLYHQLKGAKEAILFLAQGSGQPNLSKDLIDNFKIQVPKDIKDQRRIARILSTVDAVIEKTEAAIAKYKAIKQGMLHNLFTRGIDTRTGKLRPSYAEAPELYKETRLGWVPREWEVEQLRKYCERIAVGIATSSSSFFAEIGVPFLRNQNIKENKIDFSEKLFITTEFAEANSSKYLKAGDVITVRTGYPGVSAVVEKEYEGAQTFTTLITTPNHKKLNAYFLAYFINSDFGKKQVLNLQGGGAQQNLNSRALETMFVFAPNLEEQTAIVSRVQSIDKTIELDQSNLEKHQSLKHGLMSDLLTGKKQLNPEIKQPQKHEPETI